MTVKANSANSSMQILKFSSMLRGTMFYSPGLFAQASLLTNIPATVHNTAFFSTKTLSYVPGN
jgi:hypothetical protein